MLEDWKICGGDSGEEDDREGSRVEWNRGGGACKGVGRLGEKA